MVANKQRYIIGELGDIFPSANGNAFDVIVAFQSPSEKLNTNYKKKAR